MQLAQTTTFGQRRINLINPVTLAVPAAIILIIFFVVPVVQLLILSIKNPASGEFTLSHFARVFQEDVYVRVLMTTLRISILTAVACVVTGYPLAYWVAKMPRSRRTLVMLLIMVPFWTSYLVKTFAWMIVLGRTGVVNQFLAWGDLGQVQLLNNEISVMIGMVHGMLPLAVLTLVPVLVSIDQRLILAARTLGAHPSKAFWLIYFRLSMPGVASAGLLTFLTSLGFFIVPALMGSPRETFLAQLIIAQVQQVLDWGFAGALSVFLLVATGVACLIYDRIFGLSSLSGVSGERAQRSKILSHVSGFLVDTLAQIAYLSSRVFETLVPVKLRTLPLPAYCWFAILFLLAPILVVIPMSFTSSDFLAFPPQGLSLRWYESYFQSNLWVTATLRSFGIAFATAICSTLIGGMAALALARTNSRWSWIGYNILLAPMIVPRIILAAGLMYLFGHLGLVGTNEGLVIGHTIVAMPFAFIMLAAVLKDYDFRMDQAAATLGAKPLSVLRFITIPLLRDGLIASFLFAFNISFDELTIALFISSGITTTLPKQMWDEMFLHLNPSIAAASTVVFIIATLLLLISEKFRTSRQTALSSKEH